METDEKILYKFKLPYPWKSLLRGIYLITTGMFFVAIFMLWYAFIYKESPPHWSSFWLGTIGMGLIGVGLSAVMHHLLIYADRIKTPIKVTVTLENVYWNKGRANFEFYLTGIKDVKIEVDDKKAMIDVNYIEPVGTSQGWRLKFRRKDEFENDKDYEKFVKETFPKFIKVVKERIKELNPNVVIKEEDRRKKYR